MRSQLKMESRCLAKCEDGVWRRGLVVDCHDRSMFSVMLDTGGGRGGSDDVIECDTQDIIPDGK